VCCDNESSKAQYQTKWAPYHRKNVYICLFEILTERGVYLWSVWEWVSVCVCVCARACVDNELSSHTTTPCTFGTEPRSFWKEICIKLKETNITRKDMCHLRKEPCITSKALDHPQKSPISFVKEPYTIEMKIPILWNQPCITYKALYLLQKSPISLSRRPIWYKEWALCRIRISPLMERALHDVQSPLCSAEEPYIIVKETYIIQSISPMSYGKSPTWRTKPCIFCRRALFHSPNPVSQEKSLYSIKRALYHTERALCHSKRALCHSKRAHEPYVTGTELYAIGNNSCIVPKAPVFCEKSPVS